MIRNCYIQSRDGKSLFVLQKVGDSYETHIDIDGNAIIPREVYESLLSSVPSSTEPPAPKII